MSDKATLFMLVILLGIISLVFVGVGLYVIVGMGNLNGCYLVAMTFVCLWGITEANKEYNKKFAAPEETEEPAAQ